MTCLARASSQVVMAGAMQDCSSEEPGTICTENNTISALKHPTTVTLSGTHFNLPEQERKHPQRSVMHKQSVVRITYHHSCITYGNTWKHFKQFASNKYSTDALCFTYVVAKLLNSPCNVLRNNNLLKGNYNGVLMTSGVRKVWFPPLVRPLNCLKPNKPPQGT